MLAREPGGVGRSKEEGVKGKLAGKRRSVLRHRMGVGLKDCEHLGG